MADHGPTDTSEQIDDPVASSTWYVGLVGLFVFVAIVAGTDALFRVVEANKYEEYVNTREHDRLMELEKEQLKRLSSSGQIDRPDLPGEKTKAMPINQAMQQVVREHGG